MLGDRQQIIFFLLLLQQATLALTVLKALDGIGVQHGYGIARRIEQISGDPLGSIATRWGVSENNRKAKFYILTKTRKK